MVKVQKRPEIEREGKRERERAGDGRGLCERMRVCENRESHILYNYFVQVFRYEN